MSSSKVAFVSQSKRSQEMSIAHLIDAATVRRLAVEASCDPRSIITVARGGAVRGLAGQRARAALVAAGYTIPKNGKKP